VAGQPQPPIEKLQAKASGRAPSRANKVQIGAFVDPAIRTRLKVLSAQSGKPVGALIEEALADLFTKHGQ